MARFEIHDQMGMMDLIQEIGFLPLLDSGIRGFSAEEMADEGEDEDIEYIDEDEIEDLDDFEYEEDADA